MFQVWCYRTSEIFLFRQQAKKLFSIHSICRGASQSRSPSSVLCDENCAGTEFTGWFFLTGPTLILKCRPLKGLFTIFLFSVRTHILDSNEVWYSWFWSEGSINALNPKFLDFYFVPRDLDSRRHMGPRLAAQGTLTRGAEDLDSSTPWLKDVFHAWFPQL